MIIFSLWGLFFTLDCRHLPPPVDPANDNHDPTGTTNRSARLSGHDRFRGPFPKGLMPERESHHSCRKARKGSRVEESVLCGGAWFSGWWLFSWR
jgi:hypothetical protein|tara:strand:- start:21 stop:305 length:285 start_codon:yes stop_codon:yes gene_type:complete